MSTIYQEELQAHEKEVSEVPALSVPPQESPELKHCKEKYAYLAADFDNYRRRSDQERKRAIWEARARIIRDVIELLTNLDRALDSTLLGEKQKHHESTQGAPHDESFMNGLQLIQKMGQQLLVRHGVQEIPTAGLFDPMVQEALVYIPSAGHSDNTVIEVLEKGYTLDKELLRPARVSVADNKPS